MIIKAIEEINEYTGESINPLNFPDQKFELYSVPSFETGQPQIVYGSEIGSNKQQVQKNDILLCKINPRINRVWKVTQYTEFPMLASSEWIVIRSSQIYPDYLRWFFSSDNFRTLLVSQVAGIGGSLTRAQPKQVKKYGVPIPSYQRQKYIAETLDRISKLISLRKQQLVKLDELVKARFVEMFGDMFINPMNWPECSLESVADIVSGITKGRKVNSSNLSEVPYMAVYNVKDGYIDWTTVKTILATNAEIEQYRLLPNDILMTEGGDPDKLGRGAIIKKPPENCIHQNHIFRVRFNNETILPEFFAEYLQHAKAKKYFLRCAKQTTGIASINMKQLRALPVLMPPLSEQKVFVAFVRQVENCKLTVQQGLDKLDVLKKALMQEYFG